MHIVWFKRDLRVDDHAALHGAMEAGGPVLPLYILEPELWRQPDMSRRHYVFLSQCLDELRNDLQALEQPLTLRVGGAVEVLESIAASFPVTALWSHQETWNGWTFERDKAVAKWARARRIPWHEPSQHGVIRRLKSRNGWAAKWYKQMKAEPLPALPFESRVAFESDELPPPEALGLAADGCAAPQTGGRRAGLEALRSFLHERGEDYTREMSSPVTAYESCSRISPHLAFGTLSMREVFQTALARKAGLLALPRGQRGKWPSALRSFTGRLRWHCHFMQKLEDEPRIEFENFHSAYDGLREGGFNRDWFEAWTAGMTGYPLVDACMRALTATGWLNFRMRAMLMSFASYHLWLHWREPALHLARLFTDYEPGIHYSQAQMQSGTTGINTVRIYNPLKQSLDQDPDGVFIRRWVPELRDMPAEAIHTPWILPAKMNGYPMPIVDEKTARKQAADRVYGLRRSRTHGEEADAIQEKHGSRKSGLPATARRKKASGPNQQLPLI